MLTIFGYGQGPVMAPLSSTVLSTVKPPARVQPRACATPQRKSPMPPASLRIGAVFLAIEAAHSARPALFMASALFALSILGSAAFLSWMRRAPA